MGNIKNRSEGRVLDKLTEQVAIVNSVVQDIYQKHTEKVEINRKIVQGIKQKGYRFSGKLTYEKSRLLVIIESQQDEADIVLKNIERIEHFMSLLIHMEQATLAINSKNDGDLSALVDPYKMPLDKFKAEVDKVQTLKDSFEVLKVELEKQKQYIKSFSLDPNTVDEDYFFQSEEYASKLSSEEVTGISQLQGFVDDLHKSLRKHLDSRIGSGSESDRAAFGIIDELRRVKIAPGLVGLNMYNFTKKLVAKNLNSKKLDKIILFLIFFLLSRMKKYKKGMYYSQLRATVLVYNLPHELNKQQKNLLAGGTLLAHLSELDFPKSELEDTENEELIIIKKYYNTVQTIFSEEFTFINQLVDMYQGRKDSEVGIDWIKKGAKLMSLVYEFDKELQHIKFDTKKIDNVKKKLHKKFKGHEKHMEFLMDRWSKIIPDSLIPT